MLKLTFPPGSPYPNAIRAYVNEGRLIGTDEPVTAAISTALKLSDDPSVGDFAAGLFLHADKLSQASLLRILPASSTSFDSMFKHIEKTLPTLTDVRIYAASVPNVFDEDDFADFKKYFNKNLSYDSQLDLDKPGFKVKAHYSNPLTYGSIVAAAKDVKYNYLYELSDFAQIYDYLKGSNGYNSSVDAVLDADLYVHVNDPVEVVASKLPGGKSVVCGLLNSCDGYNALDVTISGDVNLKNDTGSVTAGVNASLFGKKFLILYRCE